MRWKCWDRIHLKVTDPKNPLLERDVTAIAPLIISASRSTDIPAFYGDWFFSRLAAGYAVWKSPFGGGPVYVSFTKARIFAFWSKNPAPFIPCLGELDRKGYGYFFLFTLNDYEKEKLEPGIPPLEERMSTFIRLAKQIGPGRVIWRFDPLLLSDTITVDDMLDRIERIGDTLHPFTRRLVISFIDIAKYRKVQRNLAAAGFSRVREFSDSEITALAEGLSSLNERWNLSITACGERYDLAGYKIGRGQCIGYDILSSEFSHDPVLMEFLSSSGQATLNRRDTTPRHPARYLKDPGQRSTCGCIVSKDIGQYSTCPHRCVYCYANTSETTVIKNHDRYLSAAARGIFTETITGM